jgi:hypothetical protein
MRVFSRMNRILLVGVVLVLPLGALALSPKTCALLYAPVCGSLEVQCITEPCNPILQTYSNRCFLESEGAVFTHEGECTEMEYETPKMYVPPDNCISWFDGCNTCSGIAGGPAACTLRACIGNEAPGYCISYRTEDTPRPVLPFPEELPPEPSPPPREEPGGTGGGVAENPESESPKSFVEQVWYSISSWVMSFF